MGYFELLRRGILKAIEDPRWGFGAYCEIAIRLNRVIHQKLYFGKSLDIMNEDWDTLLILDACRYDMFKQQCSFKGELKSKMSPASESSAFLRSQFKSGEYHDTIYITANPYADEIPEGTFFKTRQLLVEAWDDRLRTVRPDTVAKAIKEERDANPHKRIIGHFMQPHFPFIGDLGQQLPQAGISIEQEESNDAVSVWKSLQFNTNPQISKESVTAAYKENLNMVLEVIKQDLINALTERIVITADHGNLLGEWIGPVPAKVWGHPPGIRSEGLNRIPWFVIEDDPRPDIFESTPENIESQKGGTESQLRALGYKA